MIQFDYCFLRDEKQKDGYITVLVGCDLDTGYGMANVVTVMGADDGAVKSALSFLNEAGRSTGHILLPVQHS